MSYSVAFNSEALQAFRPLDLALQEDVLDEVDLLAAAADTLPTRSLPAQQIHDVCRERAGISHYVFLTLEYDPQGRNLIVARIGYVSRPSGGSG